MSSLPAKGENGPPAPAAKPKKSFTAHLFAGGIAGACEALSCHPLDTIKVRLQLKGERKSQMSQVIKQMGGGIGTPNTTVHQVGEMNDVDHFSSILNF